jgi:hypothetical protein
MEALDTFLLKHWIENLNIGPWFYRERIPLDSLTCRGEPSGLEMSIALSYSGDMQFGLIEVRNDAPSAYKEFRQTYGERQHHLEFIADDLDANIERGRRLGYQMEQEGVFTNAGSFVNMSKGDTLGTKTEFIPMPEVRRKIRAEVKNWSVDRDGTEPVRTSI